MTDARLFMDKINEIERRMNYVIENWESDPKIVSQEIRFILSAYLHGLYKNKNVKDLAKAYLRKIKEKTRLDSEAILTAIASALVANENFSEYWKKIKEKIGRSSATEKSNISAHLLIMLTPEALKKVNDNEYIKSLLEELKKQDIEMKLFVCWTKNRLFSEKEKINIDQSEIRYLKDYLVWELANIEKDEKQKEEVRERFFSEMLDYRIDQFDWISFLIYHFLKKNKPIIVTELELNRKIKHEVKGAISKKVWFPLIFSMIFVLVKLYLANAIIKETIGQISILIVGILFLFFEERLPSFEIPIKRYRITFGQVGEFMIIASILWAINLIHLIKELLP